MWRARNGGDVVLSAHVEVRAEFIVEVAVEAIDVEQALEAG